MRLPHFAFFKGPKIQNVNFRILLATKWDQWKLTQCQKMSVFVNSNYLWSNFWHTIQNIFKRKKGVSWSQRGMRRQRQVPKRLKQCFIGLLNNIGTSFLIFFKCSLWLELSFESITLLYFLIGFSGWLEKTNVIKVWVLRCPVIEENIFIKDFHHRS